MRTTLQYTGNYKTSQPIAKSNFPQKNRILARQLVKLRNPQSLMSWTALLKPSAQALLILCWLKFNPRNCSYSAVSFMFKPVSLKN